ncbi:MAG: type I-C CRISPR-associated protein Cas8c/Csd1 [bacterium]
MSWIQKLYETYVNCQSMIGIVISEKEVPLLPVCHTTNKAQIEIVIDHHGNFKRARVVPKDDARTIIPCTESSGGRTSGEAPHPLCDKLQYVAKDYTKYGGSKNSYFKNYESELEKWCTSQYKHPKAIAVFEYVKKERVIKDLIAQKVLILGDAGELIEKPKKKNNDTPDIFKVLKDQSEAFIRWEVEIPDDKCSKVWEDKTLWDSWINYYSNTKQEKTLCYITGKEHLGAEQHPAKLRNDGDKAKLISSNDTSGFTFRGRFMNVDQACGVGFEVTQKAHGALRWLISRQGYRNGSQAIVAWATSGAKIPRPFDDALAILGEATLMSDDTNTVSTAQNLAIKLKKKIAGYKVAVSDTRGVVVMGLDSATPGRMAITFYRELTGSEFLERLEQWHDTCAWIHDYRFFKGEDNKKTKRRHLRFVGAPAPGDIAEAAYGSRVDDKLKKSTVERLLPCIIDGQKIPRDIVDSAVRRACNRAGMEGWEWNKTLSIACALYRKLNEKEAYNMALDENRRTRDYLYGRLLALADSLEQWALNKAGEDRQTNAARLMQRFAERPYSTWRTIELSLAPYKARLGVQSQKRQAIIDEVKNMFDTEDFTSDKKLSGEFLLAYSCQREALRPKDSSNTTESETNTLSEIDD